MRKSCWRREGSHAKPKQNLRRSKIYNTHKALHEEFVDNKPPLSRASTRNRTSSEARAVSHRYGWSRTENLNTGVISELDSPWSFPLVLAVTPEGGKRVSLDCRAPSHVTRKDVHPLPWIDESLLRLSVVKCYSHIDLRSGYQQIILDLASCQTVAFRLFMVITSST